MCIAQSTWALGFSSSNPETLMHFIQNNNPLVYLSAFFGLGLLLAFTPCVLPMVPILSGIIVGQRSLSSARAWRLSLAYVIGMAVTYAVAGMLAAYLGNTLQTLMQRPLIIGAFSGLFVVMALTMLGLFELRVPAFLNGRLTPVNQNNRSFLSVALMGVMSTLIVSPCVTAPLIGVLTYIGQNGQVLKGGLILFIMALGMGMPLLLVGAGYGSFLPKTGPWMVKIKQFFGILMLGIAIWMLSRVVPEPIVNVLWALLLVLASFYLGLFQTKSSLGERAMQALGLLALIGSGAMLYESQSTFLKSPTIVEATQAPFIKVDTLQAIEEHLTRAKQENKPVFLEFYATWCSDCQGMETKVFNQPEVIKAMSGLVNIKVNISTDTPEARKIKKRFAIYGLPEMIFFDAKGKEQSQLTAAGYLDKSQLLALLHRAV